MVSGTFQICWPRSPSCRSSPFTCSRIAPASGWPMSSAVRSVPIGADRSKPLAMSHGRPVSLACLEVASGHVQPDRVAEDVAESVVDVDVRAAAAQGHDQLDLVVEIIGRGWEG